ncbi:helix-turn-helix domain-containing protein [Paramicrobacterium agarici]|uniref:Helix-turn-helix protein n=1 Tax=Paramicrobacterium agarici TaxID=630514 RepID=A0A2A9DVQ5_9MICO|nr:helix-turn-helix transcriptional regulator [Microbacterium agarici]PFG30683.1 helix-turn-helix protein [Microbacterium agarici]
MTVAKQLKRARLNAGTTLRSAATNAGLAPSNLSEIENGRRDPATRLASRIAGSLGYRLALIPQYNRASAAEVADVIAAAERDQVAYRVFLQLADDLATVDPTARVLLTAEEPGLTKTRWDDAIAALVEMRLLEVGAPVPVWAQDRGVGSADEWEPQRTRFPVAYSTDIEDVPMQFRKRGILITEAELTSV